MPNAHDVAAYILKTHTTGSMSAVKLQKLLYYSHAWHLVSQDEPLFESAIEAWQYGPVVYELWDTHRGQRTVSVNQVESYCSDEGLTDEQAALVDSVVDTFKDVNPWNIVRVVHKEAPWKNADASRKRGESDVITDEATKHFYASLTITPPSERGQSRVPRLPCSKVTYVSPSDFAELQSDDDEGDFDPTAFLAALSSARQRG